VLDYERTMKHLVATVRSPSDWGPLAAFIDDENFERVGTFLEQQDWAQYTQMLTQWASSIESFETTVRRISELAPLVYYEIEERHRRRDAVNVVNVLTLSMGTPRPRQLNEWQLDEGPPNCLTLGRLRPHTNANHGDSAWAQERQSQDKAQASDNSDD
jgi:hypothetical protein